jgi:hypothetical protein
VPLTAAAVCPSPPLLVPDLAAGAAGELDELRAACDAAVAALWSARPELVAVVGVGPQTRELRPPYRGSFAAWGRAIDVSLAGASPAGEARAEAGPAGGDARAEPGASGDAPPGAGARGDALPIGPLVGLWLLARQEPRPPVRAWTVAADATAADCARLGREIAALGRVALLTMGDGAACHGPKSPGYADSRAESFDAAVVDALTDVDTARLLALDPQLAGELLAAGRAPWQVLAGAAEAGPAGGDARAEADRAGRRWHSLLRYAAAPYGVGYYVVSWS